jgi:hypothetical protein
MDRMPSEGLNDKRSGTYATTCAGTSAARSLRALDRRNGQQLLLRR